jgi:hypothetical protein
MSGSIGSSPIQQYLSYSANEAKFAASYTATNGQDTNLLSYFQKNAASITTPAALLGNYKVLSVVLGAFGVGNLINSPALLKQFLTQNPTSTSSTAHRIGNAKYLAFAVAFQSWKPPPFSTASGISAIVKGFQLNAFEASANSATDPASGISSQTSGLQQALYFTRTAGSLTSYTQLQSDKDLLAVAVSGIGLPLTAYDNLSFGQQTALLQSKLPIADLKKPAYVQHLAEQYLVQQQLANGPVDTTPQAGSLLNAFSGSDTSASSLLGILTAGDGISASATGAASTDPILSLFA